MNLMQITDEWLTQHGFDGLFNEDGECSCEVGELMPCGEPDTEFCEAGYKVNGCTCGQGCDFHIVREKP